MIQAVTRRLIPASAQFYFSFLSEFLRYQPGTAIASLTICFSHQFQSQKLQHHTRVNRYALRRNSPIARSIPGDMYGCMESNAVGNAAGAGAR